MKGARFLAEREGDPWSRSGVSLECVKVKVPKNSDYGEPRIGASKSRGTARVQSALSLETNAFSTASGSGADSLNHTSMGPERSCRIGVATPQSIAEVCDFSCPKR